MNINKVKFVGAVAGAVVKYADNEVETFQFQLIKELCEAVLEEKPVKEEA